MVSRVRHPGEPPRDVDLGPGSAKLRSDWWAMRLTLEEQLALAARKGRKGNR